MDKETILSNVFTNINFWLKYAEKKNTYIFSFFSLMIIFTPFIGQLESINTLIRVSISAFYFLYVAAMIITLKSVFPKTKITKNAVIEDKNKKLKDTDNLLFYGDIAKYNREEYINKMKKDYVIDIGNSVLQVQLIDQIIVNSIITQKKMCCFKISSIITIIALVEFAICFGINLWLSRGA